MDALRGHTCLLDLCVWRGERPVAEAGAGLWEEMEGDPVDDQKTGTKI